MVVSQGNDAACPFMPRFVNLPQANFCGRLPLAGIRNFPFLLIDEVGVFFYACPSGERRGMPFYAAVRQFAAGKFLRRAPACGNPQFPHVYAGYTYPSTKSAYF